SFRERGLQPYAQRLPSGTGASFLQPFGFSRRAADMDGANVVGVVPGRERPGRYIVITAHYDHLGIRNGEIYNGADDNASGSAALLALAGYFVANPPRHSIIFAALDAEEMGLQGARAFVANPPVPVDSMAININMDMIGRSDAGELYVAGTHHYPDLLPYVEAVAATAAVRLIPGHDAPGGRPGDDWTMLSDHAAFHAAGIPFLYFGVEDHRDYHRATDDLAGIQPGFYVRAARTVLDMVRLLDAELSTGAQSMSRPRLGGEGVAFRRAGGGVRR
ncbi:MAG TPA: M28 family peptidase, partial [Longimicrobiales bacterium]|nr:M28 family peptidase [Longimicrobiales bacterium]